MSEDEEILPLTPEEMLNQLVDEILAALVNARIHQPGHPRVQGSIKQALDLLRQFLIEQNRDEFRLSITKEFLVYDDRPLLGASLNASRLIKCLKAWSAGGMSIHEDASIDDVTELLTCINRSPPEGEDYKDANTQLAKPCDGRVSLLPVYQEASQNSARESHAESLVAVPMHTYQAMMELLETITVSVSSGGRIDFGPVQEHAEMMLKRLDNEEGSLVNLARQDQYDAFTFGHSVRVSVLALNLGRALTDDRGLLLRLGTAALLHDVGKAMVPFEILHSNKPLSTDEREEISRHPEYGAEILSDHEGCDPHAISACFGHHCAYGTRGYPKTLHEHEVSLVTDIVGIVDVFEALTAARPYKRPMSPIRAYRIMMGMQDKFNLPLLRRFIEINGVYPAGQLLEMSDGSLARVQSQTEELCRPVVRIITDPEKYPLEQDKQHNLNLLSTRDDREGIQIARGLRDDLKSLSLS